MKGLARPGRSLASDYVLVQTTLVVWTRPQTRPRTRPDVQPRVTPGLDGRDESLDESRRVGEATISPRSTEFRTRAEARG